MAKTDAERQRERRQRLRENPRAYERYKNADRIRKHNARENMSPGELKKLRERTRKAVQKHRRPVEDENQDTDNYKYGNRASLRKAKSRVLRALPASPRKRKTVLKSLACDILDAYVVDVRPDRITEETTNAVLAFYEDDSISRMMPGKADCISIRDSNGAKVKKQKRHLVMTLAEAYHCFKTDHPDVQIGKSKFASLRPKWVLLSSQMPQNVCGCKYHENVFLLLEALHRKYPDIVPLYSKEAFTAKCKCDTSSEECMSDNCDTCSDAKLFHRNFTNQVTVEPVFKWYQWQEENGYLQKAPVEGSTTEAFDDLATQLPKFCWHSFIKDKQATSYSRSKLMAMQPESDTCLLQMDFAENFTCLWQNEIQSAHWRQRQVSVYTVMVYHREYTWSCVIVSDYREHEKCAVSAFTSQILDVIKTEFPSVKMIDVWSDGPSSQYKNKFVFALLPKLENHHGFQIRWNYFATSHGKGPNDGLGGNVKRMAHRLIMTQAKLITNAESLAEGIRSCKTGIHVLVMNEDVIMQRCQDLGTEALWDGLQAFQGTITTHCLSTTDEKALRLRYYTSAEEYRDVPIRYTGRNNAADLTPPNALDDQAEQMQTNLGPTDQDAPVDEVAPANQTECSRVSNLTAADKAYAGTSSKHNASSDGAVLPKMKSKGKKKGRDLKQDKKSKCGCCNIYYGDGSDPKLTDEWIKCRRCHVWFHETCGEDYGIIDDDELYTCLSCL